MSQPPPNGPVVLDEESLAVLFEALGRQGYRRVGPTVRGQAIVLGELASPDDLPRGWTEDRGAGSSRLARRGDEAFFGFTVGAQSWKRFLFPPHERLWQARRTRSGLEVVPEPQDEPPLAFLGVRPCELKAIEILDRVLLGGPYADPGYGRRREAVFVVSANCAEPAGTCFCASMGTGPRARSGFDLGLTEVHDGGRHFLLCESGTERGARLLQDVPCRPATGEECAAAERTCERAAGRMGRSLETEGLRELLRSSLDPVHWEEVARRCLTCGNCTLVCPTCFCNTVEDSTDVAGVRAERWRRWDSCFTGDFSYIHGGRVRQSTESRFRQWMTHKLSTWIDQFDRSGCVGCGRCITWCPVGIDITEEARALRESVPAAAASTRDGRR